MSKFNQNVKVVTPNTVNISGGVAYSQSAKLELVSLLLTSFLKGDKYYEKETDTVIRLKELLAKVEPEFAAKAAVFAREDFGMRSVSHVLAASIANTVKGEEWTKKFFERIVRRVDDMSEIIACYFSMYDEKLPNSIKKGFAKAFNKFNEYQLSKYLGNGKNIKLVDVVNLVHPVPCELNKEALSKLMKNKLSNLDTWETMLTQAGQKASTEEEALSLKSDAWKKLLSEEKLGYLALLRNIRNICEQAPEAIDLLCEQLVNEKAIKNKNSIVLPVHFIVAYNQLVNIDGFSNRNVLKALQKAMELSLENAPVFPGKTLVVLDVSGSMSGQPATIGSLFAAALYKVNDADLVLFSDNAEYKVLNPNDSMVTLANSIKFASGGTNLWAAFECANKKYDRIVILSDMETYMGSEEMFKKYKSKHKADPFVYSFDLNGYGSMQFPENKVFCLAGFSNRVFDIMDKLEKDKNALVNAIESVTL